MKTSKLMTFLTLGCVSLMLVCNLSACGDDDSGGATTDAGDTDGARGDGSVDDGTLPDSTPTSDGDTGDGGWHSGECRVTSCQGHIYQCGDCEDNDGDGVADAKDPDCLGPCDNNESGFNTEIPGGNSSPCSQECYFDQDTGAGNDDCHWDHRCDPYEPVELNPCNYANECTSCDCQGWLDSQSQLCLDFCLPLVPNGCDCFGCCELEPETGVYKFIGSPDCTLASPESCSQCTPVPSCLNECGHCEICIGKPELPPDCTTEQQCPEGVQPCGLEGQDPCPEGYYCITGCCAAIVE
jgi:hypothetical protein